MSSTTEQSPAEKNAIYIGDIDEVDYLSNKSEDVAVNYPPPRSKTPPPPVAIEQFGSSSFVAVNVDDSKVSGNDTHDAHSVFLKKIACWMFVLVLTVAVVVGLAFALGEDVSGVHSGLLPSNSVPSNSSSTEPPSLPTQPPSPSPSISVAPSPLRPTLIVDVFGPETSCSPSIKIQQQERTLAPSIPRRRSGRPSIAPSIIPAKYPSLVENGNAIPSSPHVSPTPTPTPIMSPSLSILSLTNRSSMRPTSSRLPSSALIAKTPSLVPTSLPSVYMISGRPSLDPTVTRKTQEPSRDPSMGVSTSRPSPFHVNVFASTRSPTDVPTAGRPSLHPTARQSERPSINPAERPSAEPSHDPTSTPARPTQFPVKILPPTSSPTKVPTSSPTSVPTGLPTTASPTMNPSFAPTFFAGRFESETALQHAVDTYLSNTVQWPPMNKWDVSRVSSFANLFSVERMGEQAASQFNHDISAWDLSSAVATNSMFSGATTFNQPIVNWNTSLVQDMSYMFSRAESFNQDLSSWDTTNVVDFRRMFSGALMFNQNLCSWGASFGQKSPNVRLMFAVTPSCPETIFPNCSGDGQPCGGKWLQPDVTAVPPGPFCQPCDSAV